jgi:hypothetical protein
LSSRTATGSAWASPTISSGYNEERDTLALGFPDLQNRALIIKINRLFRF